MRENNVAIFDYNSWLFNTADMDAEIRGWYFNLILHYHKNKFLPKNFSDLALLAGVKNLSLFKFSEFINDKSILLDIKEVYFTEYSTNEKSSHWNWKGGITNDLIKIRNSANYINWRKQVFTRDNFTCKSCNQKGGKLNAHHIKYFSTHHHLRFDLSNGLTLCKECHINLHKLEKYV